MKTNWNLDITNLFEFYQLLIIRRMVEKGEATSYTERKILLWAVVKEIENEQA